MVRAGKHGEAEDIALDEGIAAIGYDELPSLSPVKSRQEMDALARSYYPNAKAKTLSQWVGQLWAFRDTMRPGDVAVLPLKGRSAIALGTITGDYAFKVDAPYHAKHRRKVTWKPEIPRTAFAQDLLNSLGSTLTVCRIERNNAEQRIRAMLVGQSTSPTQDAISVPIEEPAESDEAIDIEQYAGDEIRRHIGENFRGHDFARLVGQVLKAHGYQIQVAAEGADGGVDIIAGKGAMGFDQPRLCVQVKATADPIDVKVLRELKGVMPRFGASQGLIVSWGGFNKAVYREARELYFDIRLWDADIFVSALLEAYEELPGEVQAEVPLKRVWTLVSED